MHVHPWFYLLDIVVELQHLGTLGQWQKGDDMFEVGVFLQTGEEHLIRTQTKSFQIPTVSDKQPFYQS